MSSNLNTISSSASNVRLSSGFEVPAPSHSNIQTTNAFLRIKLPQWELKQTSLIFCMFPQLFVFLLFILFCFILFYFILFYFILFYFILFYFILFYFILFYFILFYFILFYFISFHFILLNKRIN